jgi:hypothetical protein
MDFSMPACRKTLDGFRAGLLLAWLVLAGCSDPAADDRFEMVRVEARWSKGQMDVTTEQELTLSDEAKDALVHGVPITLELDLLLRNAGDLTPVGKEKRSFEIRYLPLSGYYQVAFAASGTVKTFPRLRHVLAELSRLDVSIKTGAVPAGDYDLLARIRLDQHNMPPPMRLPVLLSSRWRHDSSWTHWPLQIEPGA